MTHKMLIASLGLLALIGCADDADKGEYQGFTQPTAVTREHNRSVADQLPLADQQDFDNFYAAES